MIVGVFLDSKILLLGGSGTLGSCIIKSKFFKNIDNPSKKKLNILNKKKIENYLLKNNFEIIIHCAALARVKECESKKKLAKKINIDGTSNIVKAIQRFKKISNKDIYLVFISTDAVYSSDKGNNKETDKLAPYNFYGKTKVSGELKVKKIKKFMIVRTRFFNRNKIPFKFSANNIYTSGIEVNLLVRYIRQLITKKFIGVINVGGKKISDFNKYKKFKKNLKPCDKSFILNQLNFKIATDSSLNISKLKKIV